jgi:predicted DNA binding CopG/RHH family protein
MSKTIQIRDVDDTDYTVIRTRAAAEGLSLSAYLRRQIANWARKPTMAELLAESDRRRDRGVRVSSEDIIASVRAAREEGAE